MALLTEKPQFHRQRQGGAAHPDSPIHIQNRIPKIPLEPVPKEMDCGF